jgi:putative endonuclease
MRIVWGTTLRLKVDASEAGMTNDVERRFNEHCLGIDPKCYTYDRRPLRLEHVSVFQWVDQAISFEKKVKSWSHRKKRAFIDRDWAAIRSG